MSLLTLAIDVGGSSIKAIILQDDRTPISKRSLIYTPHPATPDIIVATLIDLIAEQGKYDRISIGFPSVVEHGVTRGAINLHPDWDGFPLEEVLRCQLGKPIRIANDADVQGCGAITGKGVELVITLGTGFGSSLFLNGKLLPNLELGQHIFVGRETYEDLLGQAALEKIGVDLWNIRLLEVIASLYKLFNYDQLYIGGGNARLVTLQFPPNLSDKVAIVSNDLGLIGGLALWQS
ncbi:MULTISPECIES: ROK family protein [Pseudanabaena]|uniref:ROK family protein n=1 Tax=Pseudanabaena TaxID=1152 RepID=UPI00247B0706|nr:MULTISPECIES: ROK family protein [Pseudanabaena]MEA5489696.1 ROK family protein [Pseudanabaena sp. CCNP1317]WGS73855.1 ROK family protein [Pseudanabaena galeata CCNP1313]